MPQATSLPGVVTYADGVNEALTIDALVGSTFRMVVIQLQLWHLMPLQQLGQLEGLTSIGADKVTVTASTTQTVRYCLS